MNDIFPFFFSHISMYNQQLVFQWQQTPMNKEKKQMTYHKKLNYNVTVDSLKVKKKQTKNCQMHSGNNYFHLLFKVHYGEFMFIFIFTL